ncbi:IclR family transcriptional regulator [Lentzea sp. NBRC 105346]|uniref:IclR family transcriptional regulator n=1 Tax=Lentzea sp. NBRC 105346 TaxID=3032205 RepID=UPI0025534D3C|nr:IclR family transcriptional regulator [Lentzea sp. NBRC 105346]
MATEPHRSLRAVHSRSPAVTRAVAILEELARSPLPLSQLARRLDLAKSTVANLCAALEACRMVRRVDGRWTLDHKVVELGQGFLPGTSVVDEFVRYCAMLPVASAETILLSVLDDMDVVYLARHDGTQNIRLASDVGQRLPAVVSGMGKALLAALPPGELESRLAALDSLPLLTRRSHRDVSELRRDLFETRRRGYAIDREENTDGVTCFGIALAGGRSICAAVSVTILTVRLTQELQDALVVDLRRLADHLSIVAAH